MTYSAATLARRSVIVHPAGMRFNTPLLVPSFSSKGFRVTDESSEVREALEVTSEWLTDSMLVSAYDLTHEHIPRPEALAAMPELTIIDSGGYEMRIEHDMSTAVHWPHQSLAWNQDAYRDELDRWPDRFLASFVSYDEPGHRVSLADQVAAARDLSSRHPRQLHTFLLKPETIDQSLLTKAIESVLQAPHQLAGFHFVGVTEKELGSSMLDRMEQVARLRIALDGAGIAAPIHVFGALDPLSCTLLFIAGAEVFDGLTWLRYAFRKGLCIYYRDYGALDVGVQNTDVRVRARILTDNLHYLKQLSVQMEKFLLDRDFQKFEHHAEFLAGGYDSLRSRLRGGG